MKLHPPTMAIVGLSLAIAVPETATASLLTWWRFDENAGSPSAADASGNGNDGLLTNFLFDADSDFVPQGGKFGGAIHFDGVDDYVNCSTGFQPGAHFTYAYFFKPDEADYAAGHERDDHAYCNARPHFSFSRDNADGAIGMYATIGVDTQVKTTTTTWSNSEWSFIAFTYDGAELSAYVNGAIEATVPASGPHTVQGDGRFNLGSNPAGAATIGFDGFMDELNIWDEALTGVDLAFIAANGVQAFLDARAADSDLDELPDFFEQLIIDDDPDDLIETLADVIPADDYDGDGSTNAEELADGTDPVDEDSDDDGLGDGVETNTGTFLDEVDTGSDPNDADTDSDSIRDGDEVAGTSGFVTDPNNPDTDGDGFRDRAEIDAGSDPTDPNSKPGIDATVLFIGGQVTATQGADAAVMSYLQDRYGAGNVTYQQASATFAGEENAFGALVISSTPGSGDMRNKFHNSTTPTLNWEEATADSGGGEYGMSTVQMTKSTTMTMMDLAEHPITDGLPSTIDFVTGGETTNTTSLFAGLTAVATAADGTGSAGPGNGIDITGNPTLFIAEVGDAVDPRAGITGSVAPSRRVMFPMTDNTFNSLTEDGLTLFGQSIDWLLGISGGIEPLRILRIGYDAEGDEITLTWNSKPGSTYSIDVSADLSSWPGDVDDSISASPDTETTSFTFSAVGMDPRAFFRVREVK